MEYFLFSATLIQIFNIKVPEGSQLDTEFNDGLGIRIPKDQPFVFEYRKWSYQSYQCKIYEYKYVIKFL